MTELPSSSTSADELRETVRERYAAAALAGRCCADGARIGDDQLEQFGGGLYDDGAATAATAAALQASLGCGVPTAVADLHEGETVLDLGSGAGADVLISARRVGPTGRAIGLDMTDEMLELARANAAEAGAANAEFLKGYLEDIPLPDASVDVVISNCVINLAADKRGRARRGRARAAPGRPLRRLRRDRRPGHGRSHARRHAAWTGCIAGALTEAEFRAALSAAGLADVEIRRPTASTCTRPRRSCVRASRRAPDHGDRAVRLPATTRAARRCRRRCSSARPGGGTARSRPAARPNPTATCIRRSSRSCASSASTSPIGGRSGSRTSSPKRPTSSSRWAAATPARTSRGSATSTGSSPIRRAAPVDEVRAIRDDIAHRVARLVAELDR